MRPSCQTLGVMKLNLSHSTLAGFTAALAGAVWLPFVYVHLFTSTPSNSTPWQTAVDQVAFDLSSESPSALLMAVWYGMPVAWFALSALFFAVPRFKRPAALVIAGLALVLGRFISHVRLGHSISVRYPRAARGSAPSPRKRCSGSASLGSVAAVTPNPSIERTRNGMPRMALISFWAMRAMPLRAAHVKRWAS